MPAPSPCSLISCTPTFVHARGWRAKVNTSFGATLDGCSTDRGQPWLGFNARIVLVLARRTARCCRRTRRTAGTRRPCRPRMLVRPAGVEADRVVEVEDRLARGARRTCRASASGAATRPRASAGRRTDGSLPAYSRLSRQVSSLAVSGSGSTRCSVSPIALSSRETAAIASTTKSTGTTLNGAPARAELRDRLVLASPTARSCAAGSRGRRTSASRRSASRRRRSPGGRSSWGRGASPRAPTPRPGTSSTRSGSCAAGRARARARRRRPCARPRRRRSRRSGAGGSPCRRGRSPGRCRCRRR